MSHVHRKHRPAAAGETRPGGRDQRERTTAPTGRDTPRLAQESGRTTIAAGIGACRNPAQGPEGPATTRRGWDSPHVARIGTDGDSRRSCLPYPRRDLPPDRTIRDGHAGPSQRSERTEQPAGIGACRPDRGIGTDDRPTGWDSSPSRSHREGWASPPGWPRRTQRTDHHGRRPPTGWGPPCPAQGSSLTARSRARPAPPHPRRNATHKEHTGTPVNDPAATRTPDPRRGIARVTKPAKAYDRARA
jgi:hypothetical protein